MKQRRLWYLALALVPKLGPISFKQICKKFGSPERAFFASEKELQATRLPKHLSRLPTPERAIAKAKEEYERLKGLGGNFFTIEDDIYPDLLKEIRDPPPVLFYRGRPSWKQYSLAVVGSRAATSYGRRVTKEWIKEIAKAGVTIVSGLALGIDTAAHEAALEVEGSTVAVLGCGLDQNYPPQNRELAEEIADKGILLTEFPLGVKPRAQNFPIRNRIISGLSQAVLVVEASPRSGSLITAHLAAEQGREVMAVPGAVYSYRSHGCHKLIREGALLVDRPEQVLEVLGLSCVSFEPLTQESRTNLILSPEEAQVLEALEVYPVHLDDIAHRLGVDVSKVSGILLSLELKGLVQSSPGNFYQKVIER